MPRLIPISERPIRFLEDAWPFLSEDELEKAHEVEGKGFVKPARLYSIAKAEQAPPTCTSAGICLITVARRMCA